MPIQYRRLASPAMRLASQQPYIDDDTRESILREIGGGLTSGLQWVGETLDKGGRAVRGTLSGLGGGDWGGGLLNLIPFSDTLGITDPHDTVSGRSLLETYGLLGENTPGFDLGDVAGFGAEVALDPASWFNFGGKALTQAGKLAKNAGLLEDLAKVVPKGTGSRQFLLTNTLDDLIGQAPDASKRIADAAAGMGINASDLAGLGGERLGNLVGFGAPFTQGGALFGTGPLAQRLAGGLDAAEHAALYGAYSPIRPLRSLFDHRVRGAMTEQGQKIGMESVRGERAAIAEAREKLAPVVRALEESGIFQGEGAADNATRMLRYLEESDVGGRWQDLPENLAPLREQLDTLKSFGPQIRDIELAAGLPSPELDDIIRYFPRERYRFPDASPQYGSGGRVLSTTTPYQKMREDALRLHGGGTAALQELSMDPMISGAARKGRTGRQLDAAEFDELRRHLVQNYVEPGKIGAMNDPELDQLVRWATNLDPRHAEMHLPAFEMNPAKAMLARLEHGMRAAKAAESVTDLAGSAARASSDFPDRIVSIDRLLRDMNLTTPQAYERFASKLGDSPFASTLRDAYGKRTGELSDIIESAAEYGDDIPGEIASAVKAARSELDDLGTEGQFLARQMFLDESTAADATRYMKSFNAPDEVKTWVKGMDKFTNLFRASVTAMFPAFHMRNFMSGQYQNFLGGAFDPGSAGPMRYLRPVLDADNLAQGKAISNVLDIPAVKRMGITNADEATKWVSEQAFAHNISHRAVGLSGDVLGDTAADLAGAMPGLRPARVGSIGEALDSIRPRSLAEANPLNIRGVATHEDVFKLGRAGRGTGHYVESLNRLAPFIAFLKQGLDPAEAAKRVKRLQVDYSALSSFERGVMTRAAPFYSFTRGSLPYMVESLIEKPGGRMAQTIRGMNTMRGQNEVTPDYIAETAAIPLGESETGDDRYLTGFNTMMEDPLSFMGNGVRGGLLEFGSRLNPLVKAPLEWMTGQSFFQKGPVGGRELDDLDPTIGRTIANIRDTVTGEQTRKAEPVLGSPALEFIAGNSPISRALTTIRQISDPRRTLLDKALGLGASARINYVSPANQETILREALDERIKELGGYGFDVVSISKDQLASMSPAQRAIAEQVLEYKRQLDRSAKTRAKQRKASQ